MARALLSIACTLLFAAIAPAQVAYYAANGNFLDSSGNGFTATVNGTVGFRPGAFGMGQGFDIQNPVGVPPAQNFLTVPGLSGAGASNLIGTGLTVAAFFIEDAFANNGSIVNFREPGNNSGFLIEPAFGLPGSILVGVYTNNGLQQLTVPGFSVGIQHHITMVFDPINQLISVYHEGIIQMSAPVAGTLPMRIDNDETLVIGRNAVSLNGFDGMIDDVRLYNRVLTPAEILAIAVPEPASLMLLAIPAGFVALRRRWRKSK